MTVGLPALDACLAQLIARLLDRRAAPDHWDGHLASSALSTATAVLALQLADAHGRHSGDAARLSIRDGTRWLIEHQNADGGWGDTIRSRSNLSTTAIVWSSLSAVAGGSAGPALERAGIWLHGAAGGVTPDALRSAILRRYGKDRTFSVPILTTLALSGKLGAEARTAWRTVPQLPFELAALPHAWFQYARLPVVSYALPALIAIGQVRHYFAPSRNHAARALRNRVRDRTHRVLREMQPESGGYLEATPLTSFVVMSLAAAGHGDSPVVREGVRFLLESMRPDGSWPIDTNLATWVTTLSVGALADAGALDATSVHAGGAALPSGDRLAIRSWLTRQQSVREHPFTHAAPGAWAWTPLSGGVPDADDTAGALLALHRLGDPDAQAIAAAAAGARWLLGLQNRDGGVPTFCRGWGALPFDRSTPEITAHALSAWSAWHDRVEPDLRIALREAVRSAMRYLESAQRSDGSWIPLWFGNERAPDEDNPVYGTARVLRGLQSALLQRDTLAHECRRRACRWLLDVQNPDGGWGGNRGVPSSIEETGVALSALGRWSRSGNEADVSDAVRRGAAWVVEAVGDLQFEPAPVGLYFARLWYYEELYPLIFSIAGLASARERISVS
jgi:squalene-hopene/tetraprenyl-beta-curcumene cyclase